ncbi:MAG: asparagine--tRNA ligase [Firmicutes bacterium]|nr:asparagine--tRNA ligase [Bacillota bacterium]
MKAVRIMDLGNHAGETVIIKGWLAAKRSSGSIHFLQIRDGSGIVQGVAVKAEISSEVFSLAGSLSQESSIIVKGKVREDKRAPGGYELSLEGLELISLSKDYPITPKEHGTDFLMDNRHLWLRSPRQNAIMKVRHELVKACLDFFDERGFIKIDAPILTPAACEGTTTLFETQYFDQKAYLSQSGQLYMEAGAMAFGNVYCFGPTFRAEKSKTRRHLIEFWMIEPEMAYCDLDEDMRIQEEMVSYIVKRVLEKKNAELKLIGRDTTLLEKVAPPFPRLSYDEAVEILRKEGLSFEWGSDFGGNDETVIASKFDKPFFVHRFPMQCKAFYMKQDPQNPKVALCADMLAPEGYGEIIGGGQREDNLEVLEEKIKEHNLPKECYEWYLDLRRYGSVPHSGFGMGIERALAWICGLDHVRETIPFPRMLYRIYP